MAGNRPVIYCVVPSELAARLHDRLRDFFADEPDIRVIVEQRTGDRRRDEPRRREPNAPIPIDRERRTVRAERGRRIEERRGVLVVAPAPSLPDEAGAEAAQVRFLERLEPSTLAREDADTARLVARIQAGHSELFQELYLRYFDRVYTYLRIALRDGHEAEDAAQDVFMRVLQALPRYERREAPFRAWLFRIVRNCAVTRMRKRQRYELHPPAALARERHETAGNGDALSAVEDPELVELIEGLPVGQRQVLLLRYMLDLSYRDIASVLERTPDAVRQLHHRALSFLRACLEPPSEEALGRQVGRVRRQPMRRIPHHSPVLRARRQVA